MRFLAVAVVLLSVACASTDAPQPLAPPVPVPDPRVPERETQLTELLDRIDVLNHRLAQLEERGVAAPPAVVAAPQRATPPRPAATEQLATAVRPQPARSQPSQPEPARTAQPGQRALIAADLAEDYREGIMMYGGGRHADARRTFEGVFQADPAGDLADNALFWIGETYFATRDYTNAVKYYTRVVNEFSDQNKAPDALFKTALAQARTGDLALARRALQQVIDRFPYSTAASSAKAEMQRIRY